MSNRKSEDYLSLYRNEAQNHYRTQKSIRKKKSAAEPTTYNLRDFLSVNIWGWIKHYLKSRFGKKHKFLDYKGSGSTGIFEMHSEKTGNGNKIKIALASDWASDTSESDRIGSLMKKEVADYTIHLGDTYFVGAPSEIEDNFSSDNASWPKGTAGTLAVPGNHEYYSNGDAFFEKLLPVMSVNTKNGVKKQAASFFCLENDYWRILGLDTGYHSVGAFLFEFIFKPDAHFDDLLMQWLKNEVEIHDKNDKRGIVLLTHHQYTSAFEGKFFKPAEQLKSLIGSDREVIWLWGHEHRFAVYGKYQNEKAISAYGRCIGHGGMPVELKGKHSQPDSKKADDFNLVFFDSREKTKIDKDVPIGYNGFAVLHLDGNQLTIEYKDESQWLFKETWNTDLKTGKIKGMKAEGNPNVKLSMYGNRSFSNAVE